MEIILLFFLTLSIGLGIIHGRQSVKRAKSNPLFAVKPANSLFTFLFLE
jgi:hypothetical protein